MKVWNITFHLLVVVIVCLTTTQWKYVEAKDISRAVMKNDDDETYHMRRNRRMKDDEENFVDNEERQLWYEEGM
jgi:hypothetical protein